MICGSPSLLRSCDSEVNFTTELSLASLSLLPMIPDVRFLTAVCFDVTSIIPKCIVKMICVRSCSALGGKEEGC